MGYGILQIFTVIIKIDVPWPDDFRRLVEFIQQFTFSFAVFKPGCSTRLEYWKLWLLFTFLPFILVIPLTMAFFIVKSTFSGE